MNTHAQAYMDETPISIRRALMDAIAIYGNDDEVDREQCIEAIAAGRPTFWTTATYHSQLALGLRYRSTETGDVVAALMDFYPEHRKYGREAALDTLVPLDRRAANALSLAYARLGSWRDDAELLIRAKRDVREAA